MTAIKLKSVLKKLLQDKNISAAKLARETKVPPQTLNNWLSGQEPRNLNHVKTVADYFKTTVDYLVYETKGSVVKDEMEEHKEEINAGVFEVVLRRVKK